MTNGGFNAKSCHFEMEFNGAASLREYADYLGSYDVTPKRQDKHMLDDVLIRTIPTLETENEAGGTTFVIGGV